MESLSENIDLSKASFESTFDENGFIQKLEKCLNDGGDVDFIFSFYKNSNIYGTILDYSIDRRYEKVAKYVLSKGASIVSRSELVDRNAIHRAARSCYALTPKPDVKYRIYEMIKKRGLELYSSPYGFTALHADCVMQMNLWSDEAIQNLETADANAVISADSPIWPGMKPIFIAAKSHNNRLVTPLLNRGAVSVARDIEGNTPLHYLSESYGYDKVCDQRLFALDAKQTFGPFNGKSHFHIACKFCPGTLNIVKRYLDQGISPDLQIFPGDAYLEDMGKTGLHLAVERECPKLVRLLLEYGANIELADSNGRVPMDCLSSLDEIESVSDAIDCACLLNEAGSNQKRVVVSPLNDRLFMPLTAEDDNVIREFLSRIKRLSMLNENFVNKQLKDCHYLITTEESDDWNEFILGAADYWNEDEYAKRCLQELEALSGLGLRPILDDSIVVRKDFESKFGWLDKSFGFESYPIYGSLLKMKFKRKLFEFKEIEKKIELAIPLLRCLTFKHGLLPHLCADLILWNLSLEELDTFLKPYGMFVHLFKLILNNI